MDWARPVSGIRRGVVRDEVVTAGVDTSTRLGWTSFSPIGRCRAALAVVVMFATVGKLVLAARTFGTGDVARWGAFARGVTHAGPVGVYRLHFRAVPLFSHHHHLHHHHHYWLYNHPPLIGYMLSLVNAATQRGVSFPLAIRVPAISADVVTCFLVLELLRTRRSLAEAFAAATLVALSPILLVISGYHGNTDPVFIMLSLLSVYLLVDRRTPGLAGLSIAIALGVKIVPVVIVPTLLVFAIRAGGRVALRFVLSMGALIALTWAPVVTQVWQPFRHDVLDYGGTGGRPRWGLAKLAAIIGHPSWVTNHGTPGRYITVFVVTVIPAVLVLRRPWLVVEASALGLVGLLALTPAFGMQYLAWAAVPAYLLSFGGATAFNSFGGFLLIEIYNRASGGFPWYHTELLNKTTAAEQLALLGVWMTLVVVMIAGIRRIIRARRPPPTMVHAQSRPLATPPQAVRETLPSS